MHYKAITYYKYIGMSQTGRMPQQKQKNMERGNDEHLGEKQLSVFLGSLLLFETSLTN